MLWSHSLFYYKSHCLLVFGTEFSSVTRSLFFHCKNSWINFFFKKWHYCTTLVFLNTVMGFHLLTVSMSLPTLKMNVEVQKSIFQCLTFWNGKCFKLKKHQGLSDCIPPHLYRHLLFSFPKHRHFTVLEKNKGLWVFSVMRSPGLLVVYSHLLYFVLL